jgi:hypothetical protein
VPLVTAADPLRTQCIWCHPPGSSGYDPDASHGICRAHADELLLAEPLERAVSRLRGDESLGRDARVEIAQHLQLVLARLDRLRMPGRP